MQFALGKQQISNFTFSLPGWPIISVISLTQQCGVWCGECGDACDAGNLRNFPPAHSIAQAPRSAGSREDNGRGKTERARIP